MLCRRDARAVPRSWPTEDQDRPAVGSPMPATTGPGGGPEPPGVAYGPTSPTASTSVPPRILAGFAGCLQVDGHGVLQSASRGQRGYAGFPAGRTRGETSSTSGGRGPGPDRRRDAGVDRRPLRHRTRYPGPRSFGAAGRPPSPRQTDPRGDEALAGGQARQLSPANRNSPRRSATRSRAGRA